MFPELLTSHDWHDWYYCKNTTGTSETIRVPTCLQGAHTHIPGLRLWLKHIFIPKKKQRTNCSHDVMSTIANLVLSQNHPKYFQNQGDRSFPIKSWSSHSLTFQWYARWRWVATLSSACFPWRNAWWPHGCTPLSHGAPTWNGSGNMGLGTPIAGWYL